ncbi:hypothetical protein PA598K_01597 [Paenibacillus sp. 598K]|uniref:DUF456 domain-containing protein n=1 Tax=Paenibacillus sp. 598K TaxID=1117987 RepID=UPI000FFA59B0|nr:DUF456 family protein [Paenibacillus sp. 598K]GBF73310.1 hypothetical protein PA598K_01597 [Paenibacillus sp. 598K]
MEIVAWVLVILLFVVGMAGAIFPILPGALAIYGAFFVYGLMVSFEPFNWVFWALQTLIVVALFIADYAVNAWGVKRFGGSRASVIGSTIGVLIGPFVIPGIGLLLGPFIGAVIGELMVRATFDHSLRVGFGSVVGLFTSTVVKILLQTVMIALFIIWLVI